MLENWTHEIMPYPINSRIFKDLSTFDQIQALFQDLEKLFRKLRTFNDFKETRKPCDTGKQWFQG